MRKNKYKVLWVSHDFPPRKTSGIYRPVNIYKYIDKDRFEIDFLTQSDLTKKAQDHNLLKKLVPGPTIYRIPNIVFDEIISALKQLFTKKNFFSGTKVSSAQDSISGPSEMPELTFVKRLYRKFIMTFYIPDEFFIWGWTAAFRGLWLYYRNGYDLVYTTSHPQSGHLAGIFLKSLGARWVADYRDGGILWHKTLLGYRKGKIREKFEINYQKYVVTRADHVITHSEMLKNDFCKIFSLNPAKVSAISNGFDDDDFTDPDPGNKPFQKNENELHLLHLGIWYLTEGQISEMIQALNRLGQKLKEKKRDLIVHTVGVSTIEQPANFKFRNHGVISHNQVASFLSCADAYLLALPQKTPTDGFLPGKLWEYLRGRKPILMFGKRDEAWQIIDEAGVGFNMNDGEENVPIDKLLRVARAGNISNHSISQFSWKSRARSFQEVFNLVIKDKREEENTYAN